MAQEDGLPEPGRRPRGRRGAAGGGHRVDLGDDEGFGDEGRQDDAERGEAGGDAAVRGNQGRSMPGTATLAEKKGDFCVG